MSAEAGATIWIEVDDLVRYYDGSITPTGIGRVQAEILPHLASRYPGRVAFCRIGEDSDSIDLLDYADIERLADGNAFLSAHRRDGWLFPLLRLRRHLRRRAASAMRAGARRDGSRRFAAAVRPGDVLLNLGASWSHRNFGRSVGELKCRHGLRFGLLVHDVLPASHPHLVSPSHAPTFNRWLNQMARVWDFVLTPSRSSAEALGDHLASLGFARPPIRPIPFGAGFAASPPAGAHGRGRSHVLYVSTIEIRKNHMLLFEVWRRLMDTHGSQNVPELVFAGKYGWEIAELRQALAQSRFLDGKIRVVENLSDNELAALYAGSLFTVFPSRCEGWGLPVAESLHFGRHCIASDATSIPEVGGPFAEYHDPSDIDSAYRLIERALFDRGHLAERERRIVEQYHPPSWRGAADAIVTAVDEFTAPAARVDGQAAANP